MGKRSLEHSAGSRFTKIDTKGADFAVIVDPRFNALLTLFENICNK